MKFETITEPSLELVVSLPARPTEAVEKEVTLAQMPLRADVLRYLFSIFGPDLYTDPTLIECISAILTVRADVASNLMELQVDDWSSIEKEQLKIMSRQLRTETADTSTLIGRQHEENTLFGRQLKDT